MDLYLGEEKPVIGIIGGMGPAATIRFQMQLLYAMQQHLNIIQDQDYYRILIDNNSQVPDRHKAFFENGQSLVPILQNSLKLFEQAKVSLIAMPCNAAHVYYKEIQGCTEIPILNMVNETASMIANSYNRIDRIGMLSTLGVGRLRLYNNILADYGIEVVLLDRDLEENIHALIYAIKGKKDISFESTHNREIMMRLKRALNHFKIQNINNVILGCTELSLCVKQEEFSEVNFIDPMNILANKVVEYAIAIEKDRIPKKKYKMK